MKPIFRRPILMHTASALLACALLVAGLPSAQPASATPPNKQIVVAPQAPEATPIVGGTSYGGAVSISPNIEYRGVLTDTHLKDFFYFDVNPGAIVTLSFLSEVTWTSQTRFYLDDQAHVAPLEFQTIVGAEQANQINYMGKSTTPTRYFFRPESVNSTGINNQYTFKLELEEQFDGGRAFDAGETAVIARLITPTLGSSTAYTGTIGNADTEDWYRIAAVSGQIISISVAVTDYGPNPYRTDSYLYDAANATLRLSDNQHTFPDNAPKLLSYISNNATPSAYLFRMLRDAASIKGTSRHTFTIFSSQQTDGNTPGDSGDDFDTARIITPTLNAISNTLGSADDNDYYKVDLPIDTFAGLGVGVPFKIFVAPVPWPNGSTGSLVITKYAANRSQMGQPVSIVAPTTDGATIDLTNCDECYIKVTDSSSGTPQLKYIFTLIKPFTVYAPFIRK